MLCSSVNATRHFSPALLAAGKANTSLPSQAAWGTKLATDLEEQECCKQWQIESLIFLVSNENGRQNISTQTISPSVGRKFFQLLEMVK